MSQDSDETIKTSEELKWSEMQGEHSLSKEQMEEEASLPKDKSCDVSNGNEKVKNVASVGFCELFRFADGLDYVLMIIGSLGAVVHGCSLPLFLRFFADLVNSFGSNANNLDKMTQEVAKVRNL